jgi:ankyrin repeat protein
MYAALAGHEEVVAMLLEAASPVNAANRSGLTALMLAAMKGHETIVRRLLAAGADPRAQDVTGKTARELALENSNTDVAAIVAAAQEAAAKASP